MFYTKDGIVLYQGDMKQGDREATTAEVDTYNLLKIEDAKPKVVTMRQARAALIQGGKFTLVNEAILNSGDDLLINEWEYSMTVQRDWTSLIALTEQLNMTSSDLDDLFLVASKL